MWRANRAWALMYIATVCLRNMADIHAGVGSEARSERRDKV